jgi:hypothetical protein
MDKEVGSSEGGVAPRHFKKLARLLRKPEEWLASADIATRINANCIQCQLYSRRTRCLTLLSDAA